MKENSIKNERSSIEEDIKVLENLLDEGFEAMCYEEAQAIGLDMWKEWLSAEHK